jgi:hypothetical protein
MALAEDSGPPDYSKEAPRETAGAMSASSRRRSLDASGPPGASLKAIARRQIRDPLDSSAGAAGAASWRALRTGEQSEARLAMRAAAAILSHASAWTRNEASPVTTQDAEESKRQATDAEA